MTRLGDLKGLAIKNGNYSTYDYDALNRLVIQNINDTDSRALYYRGKELVNELLMSQSINNRFFKLGHHCLGATTKDDLILTATDSHASLLWSREVTNHNGILNKWSPYGYGHSLSWLPGSNISLAVGTLGVVSDVTSIVCGAISDNNPEASSVLGWVSLGTGVVGIGEVVGRGVSKGLIQATSGLRAHIGNILETGLSGRGAPAAAKKWTVVEDAITFYRGDNRAPSEMLTSVDSNLGVTIHP